MKITITLEKLKNFLEIIDTPYGANYRGLLKCMPILEEEFKQTFLRGYGDVSQISTKEEMAKLISGGKAHKPLTPRPGPNYNEEYLDLKDNYGEYYPHKFLDYGFWMGTDIDPIGSSIRMKTQPGSKTGNFSAGQGDYLSFHETRRSVLKKTFINAWQRIIDELIKNYAEEAQK